jgi:uncharacterized membrane protein
MIWLLITVVLLVLWSSEFLFGGPFGAQLSSQILAAVLIYAAFTVNKLQKTQSELQKELERLWKTVNKLQVNTSFAKPSKLEQEPDHLPKFTETNHAFDDAVSEAKSAFTEVIWANEPVPVVQPEPVDQSGFEPELNPISAVTAIAEKIQPTPAKDPWSNYDLSEIDQSPGVIEQWLAGGNWIVRGGLAILFIGLVFLAKFAYENAMLPLELRLAAIAGFAIALLMVGWRSRLERSVYGLSLQGGGIAALYLTVFATSKLTVLLSPGFAMAVLLLVAILAAWLAILQDAMILAVIGTIGGFMAPVLLSTGQGSHIALFSYFAALNAGIITVSMRKAWRPLNVLAFFFTFGIAGLWGAQGYRPEFEISCLFFLCFFYALFVVVSILFARLQTQKGDYDAAIDATLLFGVPTVTFGYALFLLKPHEYGGAFAAVTLSAIYVGLAFFAKGQEVLSQLKTPWAALGLVFATLSIPLACDPRVTASIWALEGSAVISYGWMQNRFKARLFGYCLVLIGTIGFMTHWPDVTNSLPILNALTVGLILLALAYGVIGTATNRFVDKTESGSGVHDSEEVLIVSWIMAIALALAGALVIMTELYMRNSVTTAGIAAPALLWLWALVLQRVGVFSQWSQTTAPSIVLPILTLLLPINYVWVQDNLTSQGLIFTALSLTALLAWQAHALKKLLPDWQAHFGDAAFLRTVLLFPGFTLVGYWWLILIRGRNIWSSAINPESGFTMHGWFIPLAAAFPVILLWWLSKSRETFEDNSPRLWQWLHGDCPLPDHTLNNQLKQFTLLALVYLVATSLFHSGHSQTMSYIPLFNLYELIAIAALLATLRALRNTKLGHRFSYEQQNKMVGGLTFVFANSILSRILANYFDARFEFGFAWQSAIAATTYSIVWTLSALVAMWIASVNRMRGLWLVGAVLLAVVAGKLILIDLSKVGSLARIVSFIGVGALMLVVGYVAPLPPKEAQNSQIAEL